MVSILAVRSLNHFELIFLYSVRKYPNLIVLHAAVQFSPVRLVKENVFSPLYILASFVID